jgi:hypothetical protein
MTAPRHPGHDDGHAFQGLLPREREGVDGGAPVAELF